jgi:hypothetical protein
MKQSRKDFIIEAHDNACNDWRNRIEKEFPKLFKKDALVVGEWYNYNSCLLNYQGINKENYFKGYGIIHNKWSDSEGSSLGNSASEWIPVTDKEVEKALTKEAKKRGFKKGVFISNEYMGYVWNGICFSNEIAFKYGTMCIDNIIIYEKGKWATIVETITKEQAEKELGKTILN